MAAHQRLSAKVSSLFDRILNAFLYLGAGILAFLLVAVCWDVIGRTLFGKPLTWVLEFTEYGLLYMTFLCAAWVLRTEGHVTNDLILTRLHPKNRALCNAATSVLGAIICLVLTWFGAVVSWEKLQSGAYQPTAIEPPDFPIFVVIPIGFFLLSIQFLRRAHGHMRNRRVSGSGED